MMISAMGVNLAIVNTINKVYGGNFRKFPIPDEWRKIDRVPWRHRSAGWT